MLIELTIGNFAIIDDLSLDLGAGLTVLSGETGAGKSILIHALGLLLGDRAEADSVRDGCERAQISAVFRLVDAPAARAWLGQRDDAGEDECILRRVVAREGRSRAWINGRPATVVELRELGEHLVDIHGQHAHQSLLRPALQRGLLDAHGGHEQRLAEIRDSVAELAANDGEIRALEGADAEGNQRLDLLRYQVEELEALGLGADELPQLEAEHRRLGNAERLLREGGEALGLLYEGEPASALDLLAQSERLLRDLATIDLQFEPAAELAAGAGIQARESADVLRRALAGQELDPARLHAAEARLAAIQDLARKHRCTPQQLPERAQTLAADLAALENSAQRLLALRQRREQLLLAYSRLAEELHQARLRAGAALAQAISRGLHELGMPAGQFEVLVTSQAQAAPSAHGSDKVAFRVSANPGQAPRALERIASGGELSRISLAIQVAAAGAAAVPTLVFDEVDAGIGGGVAEIVGRRLRSLGKRAQVLCVTHLPQVAAQASHHLQVSKAVRSGHTQTLIEALDADSRVEELARMLGGLDITAQTRAHAREMIQQAAAP